MDINNYSFAPYILDTEEEYIERYENDDMQIEFWKEGRKGRDVYIIWSYSYDGSLDVSETFKTEEGGRALYNIIFNNYIGSPPDDEILQEQIAHCHRLEEGTT